MNTAGPRTIYLVPARNAASGHVQLQTRAIVAPRSGNVVIRPVEQPQQYVLRASPQKTALPIVQQTTTRQLPVNNRTVKTAVVTNTNTRPTVPVQPQPKPVTGLKRAATMPIEDILNETCNQSMQPRKRERLTHLTVEEKMNRRKLKNRVAAQTARDRKKERTGRLEDAVRRLFEENERLRDENFSLRSRLDCLEDRDVKRQQKYDIQESNGVVAEDVKEEVKTFGSAAFISEPQQREQVNPSTNTQLCPINTTKPRPLMASSTQLIWLAALLSLMRNSSRTSSPIFKRLLYVNVCSILIVLYFYSFQIDLDSLCANVLGDSPDDADDFALDDCDSPGPSPVPRGCEYPRAPSAHSLGPCELTRSVAAEADDGQQPSCSGYDHQLQQQTTNYSNVPPQHQASDYKNVPQQQHHQQTEYYTTNKEVMYDSFTSNTTTSTDDYEWGYVESEQTDPFQEAQKMLAAPINEKQQQHNQPLYHHSDDVVFPSTEIEFSFDFEEDNGKVLYNDPLLSSPNNTSNTSDSLISDPMMQLSPFDADFTNQFYSLIE